MAKLQVVDFRPLSGTSEKGRAWEMLIVDGIFTDDQGVVMTGEISLMKQGQISLPTLVRGQTYECLTGASKQNGRLSLTIQSLRPLKAVQAA